MWRCEMPSRVLSTDRFGQHDKLILNDLTEDVNNGKYFQEK